MGRVHGRADGRRLGGIAELVTLIDEHGPAIDYDLMTMTRYTLRDVGGALPWGALRHFLMYLPRESALSREMVPPTEEELWANGKATAAILADIFDLLHQLNNNVMAKGTGKSAKKAKPYPRPWRKGKQRKLGKDPIPISQFEEWWEKTVSKSRG